MTITIDLPPEVEERLRRQAATKEMSIENYIALILIEALELPEENRNKITVTMSDL